MLAILASSGTSISGKRMANHLEQHMFFIMLLLCFVLTVAFFIAAHLVNPGGIPASSTSLSKHKFVVMAAGDTLQMVLMMLASARVPGQLQGLLSKATIPATLLIKYLFLGTTFSTAQIGGASMIVLGAAVSMGGNPTKPAEVVGTDNTPDNTFWYLLFLLSTVPAAASAVYKEVALSDTDVEDNYLNAWVTLFQCGFTVVCLPLQMFLEEVPFDQLVPRVSAGVDCIIFGGSSSLVSVDGSSENCDDAWQYVTIWLLCIFALNVLMTMLVKRAGATLMFGVSTLTTPLTALAFRCILIWHSVPSRTPTPLLPRSPFTPPCPLPPFTFFASLLLLLY
jgi:drug/metabolite transporter (DMT)-like permease